MRGYKKGRVACKSEYGTVMFIYLLFLFSGKFSLGSRKKDKSRQVTLPDVTMQGAIVWLVQVR